MSRREISRFAPESDPPPAITNRFSRASICTSASPASPCKSSPNPSPACTPRLLPTCPWESQSTRRVLYPRRARPAPRLTQEVVLATPPFALVKPIFLNPSPRRYVQPATAPIPSPMIACVSSWRVFEWLSLSGEPDPPFLPAWSAAFGERCDLAQPLLE